MTESEATTRNLTNLELEELCCSMCKEYLLCSPVRLLPDGTCFCGSCSPLTSDAPIYRVLPLETFLRKTSFPCKFKKYGCPKNVLFGKAADHQNKCAYQPCTCPSLTSCLWEGLPSKLYDHFTEQHADFIKETAEFNLHVDQNSKGVFMTVQDSFAFIVKYVYNTNETNLKYDVRFCTNKIGCDASFKSKLINALDAECRVILKTNKCSVYDQGFYEMQKSLNLNKFLPSLGDPNSITVMFKFKILTPCGDKEEAANNLEVNFDLIKSLKCHKCKNYLVPPLFDLCGNAVCCDCAKNNDECTPSKNADLLKLVNEAVYPCRWRDCDFVASSVDFKGHEGACQFRSYNCWDPYCQDTFKLSELINHLVNAHAIPFSDKTVYKTSFGQCYKWKRIFNVRDSVPILIGHEMINSISPYTHRICILPLCESYKITGILNFEHQHCRLQSQEFVVCENQPLNITLKQLPPCFKEKDELTVTVKLNIE